MNSDGEWMVKIYHDERYGESSGIHFRKGGRIHFNMKDDIGKSSSLMTWSAPYNALMFITAAPAYDGGSARTFCIFSEQPAGPCFEE